ncbi:MAG: SdpA family antimicrobial peptide system protein [Chitinophagaceae bacterium]|nr:SdpA family antimicrobial peptide system protein [Chitinophagaceae bacterium]
MVFFTRSPREEMADIYIIQKDKSIKKLSSQCSAFSNLCGVSRKSRKIGMELSIVASKINDSLWLKQEVSWEDIEKLPVTKITMDTDNKYLVKGDYIINAVLPIPWAWAKSKTTKPKTRIVRIQII